MAEIDIQTTGEISRLLNEMSAATAGKSLEVVLIAAANFVGMCIHMQAESPADAEDLLQNAIRQIRATLFANTETPPRSAGH